jgi:mono/diheme cytochrome c family protein
MQRLLFFGLSLLLLAACTAPPVPSQPATAASPTATSPAAPGGGMGMGMGMRMGMRSGMMARHSAPIPAPYAGVTSPVPADADSLARGAEVFGTHCASCHGDGGMGDGPASAGLDPAPAPVAHTSQMMGDDYLFWRISEGGVPFGTAMPVWKETLDEQQRWDAINYVRALGAGQVAPGRGMGGAALDPQAEAEQRAAMLAQAVEQAVITPAEAEAFSAVHAAMDAYLAANPAPGTTGSPMARQAATLAALVEAGAIPQAQADTFTLVHSRLLDSGLMQ